jgi:hypothetical protein
MGANEAVGQIKLLFFLHYGRTAGVANNLKGLTPERRGPNDRQVAIGYTAGCTVEMSNSDPFELRKKLSFEQAEGAEPLPSQLKLKELSPELRALLWQAIYYSFERCRLPAGGRGARSEFIGEWHNIFYTMHVEREHRMADEFVSDFEMLLGKTKTTIQQGDYLAVFGWIQYALRLNPPNGFADAIQGALIRARAAYRVVDGDTFVPIGSEAESQTIVRTFADLAATEFHGARQHLRNAAEELTNGNNSDSIRESIHAVESVISVLEPDGDFAKALGRLDARVGIHGAMKAGFASLYGFTSDENGIRHPLLQDAAAEVDETDALFMIGACAAFVSYLINKARSAGLLSPAKN